MSSKFTLLFAMCVHTPCERQGDWNAEIMKKKLLNKEGKNENSTIVADHETQIMTFHDPSENVLYIKGSFELF